MSEPLTHLGEAPARRTQASFWHIKVNPDGCTRRRLGERWMKPRNV
jgi:hypothetical protein